MGVRLRPSVDLLSDETLLAGYTASDPEITRAFVRRFQSRVFGIAFAVIRDRLAAEDIAQEAFERAWRHGSSYDPLRGTVAVWLTTITRNLAIDAARVRRTTLMDATELLERIEAGEGAPEVALLQAESASALRRALGAIPLEQARAIVLASIAGMSASEVARSEGIPLGTAKTRIRTAMLRLRSGIAAEGVDR